MIKLKIKTGDIVRVIAGDHKGEEGKVLRVYREKNKAIVEGVNMVSKHTKPSAKSPQGGIVKKEASIQISNISLIDRSMLSWFDDIHDFIICQNSRYWIYSTRNSFP